MVKKWAGSIEVGVTTHRPQELDFPSTMTNVRSGTWMMTGNGVMHNGTTIHDDYGHNLDRLAVRKNLIPDYKPENSHFFVPFSNLNTNIIMAAKLLVSSQMPL